MRLSWVFFQPRDEECAFEERRTPGPPPFFTTEELIGKKTLTFIYTPNVRLLEAVSASTHITLELYMFIEWDLAMELLHTAL